MGARKAGEQHVRTLAQNNSGTYVLSLPIAQMRELDWRKGQKVVVHRQGKKLLIEDWKAKK